MEAIALKPQKYQMFHLKFLPLLFNPKVLGAILLFDLGQFFTKYVFEDITYLKFLAIACIVDFITGVTKVAIRQGVSHISSRGLRDSVSKGISYGAFLILIHTLTHFQINNQVTTTFAWLNKAALEFLILVEVRSIYENVVIINPKLDFLDAVIQKIVDNIKGKTNANK